MKFLAVVFGLLMMLTGGGILFLGLAFMKDLGPDTSKYLTGFIPVLLFGFGLCYFGFRILAGVNAADKRNREG